METENMKMDNKKNKAVINAYLEEKILNHRLEWLMVPYLEYLHKIVSCELVKMEEVIKKHKSDDGKRKEIVFLKQNFKITFDDGSIDNVEVHLFDFHYDIYFKNAYTLSDDIMNGLNVTVEEPSELEKNIHRLLMEYDGNIEKEYFDLLGELGYLVF